MNRLEQLEAMRNLTCGRCMATTTTDKQPGDTMHCSECQYTLTVGTRYAVRFRFHDAAVYSRMLSDMREAGVRIVYDSPEMLGFTAGVWAWDEEHAIWAVSQQTTRFHKRACGYPDIYAQHVEPLDEEG